MNVSLIYGKDEYDISDCSWDINNTLYKRYKVKGFFFCPYFNDSDELWKTILNKINFIKCTDKTIFKLVDVRHLESISDFDDFIEKRIQYHLYPSLIVAEIIDRSDTNGNKLLIHARRVIIKQQIIKSIC